MDDHLGQGTVAAAKPAPHGNKRKRLYTAGAVVIIIVIAVVAVLSVSAHGSSLTALDNVSVNSSVLSQLSAIAANTTLANMVGAGIVSNLPVPAGAGNLTPLTYNGKPGILYLGADYCPFCAVTRWGLIMALMRFGSFSSLHYMTSNTSASEPYPGSPTFTFYNSSYQSGTIAFVGVEEYNHDHGPLQSVTAFENNIYQEADINNPNLASDLKGGIPFIDFGNVTIQGAAPVSPSVIYQNNWQGIIANLSSPGTLQAQALVGEADVFTAQICRIDNYTPSSVCDQPYIKKILAS